MGLIPPFEGQAVLGLHREPLYDEASARELLMSVGPPDGAADIASKVAEQLSAG